MIKQNRAKNNQVEQKKTKQTTKPEDWKQAFPSINLPNKTNEFAIETNQCYIT